MSPLFRNGIFFEASFVLMANSCWGNVVLMLLIIIAGIVLCFCCTSFVFWL